ncbi:hypothetical protein [Bacillus sp. FJAT-27916]|nr:hypothetical protein [Bacillus sp. FJAT-27916]
MSVHRTPEEMYKKRKIKQNILYASLIITVVGIIIGLQFLLYNT